MSQQVLILRGYRRLLRSATNLFQTDSTALNAARKEIRKQFELKFQPIETNQTPRASDHPTPPQPTVSSSNSNSKSKWFDQKLKDIDEAVDMLDNHLVQAKLNQRGNFEITGTRPISVPKAQNKAAKVANSAKDDSEAVNVLQRINSEELAFERDGNLNLTVKNECGKSLHTVFTRTTNA